MKLSIGFSFLYIFIYCIGVGGFYDSKYLFAIFLFSPIVVLWVVYSILTDKNPPVKTFTEYFYQDSEIRRTQETKAD